MRDKSHLESPRDVWTNLVYKTYWTSLSAKQAIIVGSSSGFYVNFPHDWSNFDLPKLTTIEHISFDASIMVVSYWYTSISYSLRLSQSGICGRQRPQKLTMGVSNSSSPLPSLPSPPPFFLSSQSSSPATSATQAIMALLKLMKIPSNTQ